MPEIYLVIVFFILNGLMSPDFGDFSYYFMLNTCHITKFQYSMLGTIGQFTSILGVQFYSEYLKDVEVRTVMYYSTVCSIISSLSQYAMACRWNTQIGVPDLMFIVCTDTIFGIMSLAMNTLPTLALFAKVTPAKIEGTVFAFLTGTTNLANSVLAPMVGVFINEKFAGVTAEDLSNYKKLCLISLATSFLGFFILPLIPHKADINKWQEQRAEAEVALQLQKDGNNPGVDREANSQKAKTGRNPGEFDEPEIAEGISRESSKYASDSNAFDE